MPEKSGFDPLALPESNATLLPEPYGSTNRQRWYRRLGDHAKLGNFGVNLLRVPPGAQSAPRHAHSRQDEFVYVLKGEVELETDAGVEALRAGLCAGFPAGTGNAHRFVNRSAADALLLVVGDRTACDEVSYPGYRPAWPDGRRRQICFHAQGRNALRARTD